ncbi:MAG: hypothetical protein QHH74_11775 [Spirochaetota bacterium]|nr:hypothetical protein [Spirochaetota bacterium]
MNTGLLLTIIAAVSFVILIYLLIKQLLKLVVIIAVLFIMFAGYIYIKNGSLPANLKGYAEEGKRAIEQLHQSYLQLVK